MGEGCADYLECTALSDATSCRAFDATNHRLSDAAPTAAGADTVPTRTAAEDGGVLVVSVGADAADAPRAEVTIIERSTELLGPFASRPTKTDDEPPPTLPPPRFRPTPDAPDARATLREGDKATLPRGLLPP